jgi:Zn-dependent protease with chaperone function
MPAAEITAVISLSAAIIVAFVTAVITYLLTRRREHEADWRKLKFGQYQEFVLALSEIVELQSTHEKQVRYANAVNSMSLVAPISVLNALRQFQDEISYR